MGALLSGRDLHDRKVNHIWMRNDTYIYLIIVFDQLLAGTRQNFCCCSQEAKQLFWPCRWGSSLPNCARWMVSLVPPSTCLQSHLQTSTPTPQNSNPKFQNPRRTLENPPICHISCFNWRHFAQTNV